MRSRVYVTVKRSAAAAAAGAFPAERLRAEDVNRLLQAPC